jgi:hydroxymethylpyrimidine pyrophosphatase-like HAD family hydrolase
VPDAGLAWELANGEFGFDRAYAGMRPDVAEHYPDHVGERPPVVDGMLKLLVRHPQMDEAALLSVLEPVVPTDVLATYSGIDTVEITGAGIHKAHALAVVCDRLGIAAREVVALGDNRNDTEMLRWAGRGVAMGNALPAVVAVADEQTGHHMDDGVAIVIEDVLAGLR